MVFSLRSPKVSGGPAEIPENFAETSENFVKIS
jgi:hypothetical protein